jgi:hypothetical protein|tara:strand:- start:39 stop:281 length:243 start_codon:yes stop_codon:yes gene_type:complete
MSASKKKAAPQKSETEPKKETPKKEEPKEQPPKKAAPTSVASLKEAFIANCKANPRDASALKAQYKKDRKALRGTLKSKK